MILSLKDEFNRLISEYTTDDNYVWCVSIETIYGML